MALASEKKLPSEINQRDVSQVLTLWSGFLSCHLFYGRKELKNTMHFKTHVLRSHFPSSLQNLLSCKRAILNGKGESGNQKGSCLLSLQYMEPSGFPQFRAGVKVVRGYFQAPIFFCKVVYEILHHWKRDPFSLPTDFCSQHVCSSHLWKRVCEERIKENKIQFGPTSQSLLHSLYNSNCLLPSNRVLDNIFLCKRTFRSKASFAAWIVSFLDWSCCCRSQTVLWASFSSNSSCCNWQSRWWDWDACLLADCCHCVSCASWASFWRLR